MKRKNKILLSTLITSLIVIFPATLAMASTSEAEDLVKTALNQKTFYHFNSAYAKIMEMPETSEKYWLLNELTPIQGLVWTDEINKSLKMITDFAKTGSAKSYDEVIDYVSNSKLGEWDRGYLLGELAGWGRKLVYTEDYVQAVDAIVNLYSNLTEENITNAKNLVNSIKNKENMEYLLPQLQPLVDKYQEIKLTITKGPISIVPSGQGNIYKVDRSKLPEGVKDFVYIGVSGSNAPITKRLILKWNKRTKPGDYGTYLYDGINFIASGVYPYMSIVLYDKDMNALGYFSVDGDNISDLKLDLTPEPMPELPIKQFTNGVTFKYEENVCIIKLNKDQLPENISKFTKISVGGFGDELDNVDILESINNAKEKGYGIENYNDQTGYITSSYGTLLIIVFDDNVNPLGYYIKTAN